jgi:uncharacterized protein
MPRVIHFEIPADDPDRACAFYAAVFGWKIAAWGGPMDYRLCQTGQGELGIDGAIMPRHGKQGVINTIGVSSVDAAAEQIQAAGGKILTAKAAIPGVGYFAYCQDTEGNPFGIMQNDPTAR